MVYGYRDGYVRKCIKVCEGYYEIPLTDFIAAFAKAREHVPPNATNVTVRVEETEGEWEITLQVMWLETESERAEREERERAEREESAALQEKRAREDRRRQYEALKAEFGE